mmetsp:Transcript_43922/g.110223  ORF Transcript_43922/g.110223 Transcript_43922/m.110223 type:complete len:331 (+) Transcript_43922:1971-2963(+)
MSMPMLHWGASAAALDGTSSAGLPSPSASSLFPSWLDPSSASSVPVSSVSSAVLSSAFSKPANLAASAAAAASTSLDALASAMLLVIVSENSLKSTPAATSSPYVPKPSIRPSLTIRTRSALARNCSWWVTRMRVRPLSSPQMHSSMRCAPTCASTADSGSSSRYTSACAYTALASATRCFWPPDRLMPFSPISVSSPAASALRSCVSPHADRVAWYSSGSSGRPARTLSRRILFWIHGSWLVYATVPCTDTSPLVLMDSPRMDCSSVLLPLPTSPTTTTSSPAFTVKSASFRAGLSASSDHVKLALETCTAGMPGSAHGRLSGCCVSSS